LDLADDYLNLSPDPHILIEVKSRNDVSGSYQFGASDGAIDGHFEKDQKGNMQLIFTFEGCDEMDTDNGYGTASFEAPGILFLTMHHHMGDTYSYRCRRDQG
jgi:hypothetical protein